jgi:serine protease Do
MRLGFVFAALFVAAALSGNLFSQTNDETPLRLLNAQFRPSGSYLGVRLHDIDADQARALKLGNPRGVEVTRVEPDSPAEEAGLKPGDVILAYNGENILGAQQLGRLVAETPQGRKIKVQYWRDGKPETTIVTTGAPPSHAFGFPPGDVNFSHFNFPDMHALVFPVPLVVWKDPTLGIECEQISSQLGQYFGVKEGALVRSVEKGSPSDKAGIKAGDVITSLGNQTVSNPRDLTSYARADRQPSSSIPVDIIRDHKSIKLTITVAGNRE